MSINDILNAIQANNVIILLFAVSIALYRHRKTSFVVAALLLSVMSLLHMVFQLGMNVLFNSEFYDGVIYDIAVRLWYMFYAFTDFFAAVFLYHILKRLSLRPDMHCNLISICFIALGFIQVGRYSDKFVTGADNFAQIYQVGIPFINTLLVLIVVLGVFLDRNTKIAQKEL